MVELEAQNFKAKKELGYKGPFDPVQPGRRARKTWLYGTRRRRRRLALFFGSFSKGIRSVYFCVLYVGR